MSGHSKWSNIRRRKQAVDAQRSKIFSKIVKEIQVAVKESGNDPDNNPRLRLAIQNAKSVNMPKENIQRAIKKASTEKTALNEMSFEGYAPGGVAIFLECLTDNNKRTISNIRAIFNKRGGNLTKNGSLNHIFERKGVFYVKKDEQATEEFQLEIIDAGVDDIDEHNDMFIITVPLEKFGAIQKKLDEMDLRVEKAELQRIPNTTIKLDLEQAKKVLEMIEDFEDNEDVQNVFHNLAMTDELEKELTKV